MKKFLVTLFMIFVLSTASYGASEDIYVRQDVFDAKMEALFNRMDKNLAEFKAIANEIKGDVKALDAKLTSFENNTDIRFATLENNINARLNSVENNVTWWIGGFTLFLTALGIIPLAIKLFEKIRVPSITLEDVMRLIEENNARLAARPTTGSA